MRSSSDVACDRRARDGGQTQKATERVIPFLRSFQKGQSHRHRERRSGCQGWGWTEGGTDCSMGQHFLSGA